MRAEPAKASAIHETVPLIITETSNTEQHITSFHLMQTVVDSILKPKAFKSSGIAACASFERNERIFYYAAFAK